MQAYLKDEDILKPGEVDIVNDGTITTFCVPISEIPKKVSETREKEHVTVRGRKSTAKYKKSFNRAKGGSKLLADFEFVPEMIDSDEDLPVVNIGTGDLSTKNLTDTVQCEKTSGDNVCRKNYVGDTSTCVKKQMEKTDIEDGGDKLDGVKREKRHNRKKRKSGSNRTFVELIADDDNSDFLDDDNKLSESFVDNRVDLIDQECGQSLHSTSWNQDNEERMDVASDVPMGKEMEENLTLSQVFTVNNGNMSIKLNNVKHRVRTPPPIGEVDEIFAAMKTLPKVDIFELVRKWEIDESSDPDISTIDNCEPQYTELKFNLSSKTPEKIFIPFQDVLLTKPSPTPVSQPSKTVLQHKTPKLSSRTDNDDSLCDLFSTSFVNTCHTGYVGKCDTPVCGSEAKTNRRSLFKENWPHNINDFNGMEEENSFTLLKRQQSPGINVTESTAGRESLIENRKSSNSSQFSIEDREQNEKETKISEKPKSVYEINDNSPFEDDNGGKEQNEEKIQISENRTIMYAINKNSPFEDDSDEKGQNENKINISEKQTTVYEITENCSFEDEFSDDDLADAVTELETPSKHNGSTQYTFTQALDCLHSNSADSSDESFTAVHGKCSSSRSAHDSSNFCFDKKKTQITTKVIAENIDNNLSSHTLHQETVDSETAVGNKTRSKEAVSELANFELLEDTERSIFSDSDEDVEVPKFDLGYNIDDDIVPPSPNASQSFSQKSFSGKLGQLSFSCRRSLSLSKGPALTIQNEDNGRLNLSSNKNSDNAEEQLMKGAEKRKFTRTSNQMILPPIEENGSSINDQIKIGRNGTCTENTSLEIKYSSSDNKLQLEKVTYSDENKRETNHAVPPAVLSEIAELSEWDSDEELIKETTNFNLGWEENFGDELAFSEEECPENCDDNKSVEYQEDTFLAADLACPKANVSVDKLHSPKLNVRELTVTPPSKSLICSSPDLDDSFIVRRKRKVAFLDSPFSQDATEKTVYRNTMNKNNASPGKEEFKTPVKPVGKTRNKKAKLCDSSPYNTDSDDGTMDKTKKFPYLYDAVSDDDDFVCNKRNDCKRVTKDVPKKELRNPKKKCSRFIDDEADLSVDGESVSSDESDHSDLDRYDASMINDMTQFSQEPEDMHAVYLKSVRSPISIPNRFKLQYKHRDIDVFSQAPQEEDESQYMEDSFCVGEDFEDYDGTSHEDTDLDLTSPIRGKRKPKRILKKCPPGLKRVRQIQESSSEDEQEALPNFDMSFADESCNKSKNYTRKAIVTSSSEDDLGDFFPQNTAVNFGRLQTESYNSELSVTEQREERLKKQRQKQDEFRKNLAEKQKQLVSCDTNVKLLNQVTRDSILKSPVVRELDEGQGESLAADQNSPSNFEKAIVFVDSRELSGAQDIVSSLRFEHKVNICTAQLSACDYIVSNRMAVERMHWAEFSNGSNRKKIIQHIQHLCDLYERPCLIIEKDRSKTGDGKGGNPIHWTQYAEKTMTLLAKSTVKVFFTETSLETAGMIAELCNLERRKNLGISVPVNLSPQKAKQLKFYLSIPRINYVNALNLCHNFQNISEFLRSLVTTIQRKGQMEEERAKVVHSYLRREFDPQMLPTGIG